MVAREENRLFLVWRYFIMISRSSFIFNVTMGASALLGTMAAIYPANAAVAPLVTTLSSITEGVSTPVRAALDQLGNFYVTDPRGGGVLKYNNAGRLQRKFPVANPLGIAVTLNGELLVSQGSSVAVINQNSGTITSNFGSFTKANGIAVDSSGFIYVTDSVNNCVQVFTAAHAPAVTGMAATGKPSNSFGTTGRLNGQFLQPTGISFEKISNQLAVADTRNGRVQFFSTSGVYQKSIGSFGVGPLRFTSPQAITFEYSDDDRTLSRIYVVDSFQSNVQVIDATTMVFSRYIGSYGLTGGKLFTPGDVILDRFDTLNKRLLISNGTGALTLFGIDTGGIATPSTGPALTVGSLPLATNLLMLTITGTTESGATVTVNGAAATVSGSSWSKTVTLSEGINLITVIAVNAKGSTVKTASVNVLPPSANPVSLTLNPAPALTGSASITLSGTVTSGASLLVNNTPATVTGTGWTLPVTLTQGINSFLITASRTGMDSSSTSINIVLDRVAPVLTAFLPQNNTSTAKPVLSISGTVTDSSPSSVTVTVNNASHYVPVSDGTFSLAVILGGGTNLVTVSATDAAGNQSSFVSSTMIYNPLTPKITLTTPSGVVTSSPNHIITGTAPAGSVVTVNSLPVTLNATLWTTSVTLTPGMNYFAIKATAPDGTSSTIVDTVSYGQNLPTISVTSPTQDLAIAKSSFILTGIASSGSTVTARVNGTAFPVSMTAGEAFSLALTGLTIPGSYEVNLSATDSSGNTSSVTRTLIYDPTVPVISVAASVPPKVTATDGVLVARDKNGPVGTVTTVGGVSTLDLTGVAYDPATLNIYTVTSAGTSTRDGDLNLNGKVDIADALLALRTLLGLEPPPSFQQMLHGDVGPILDHDPTVDSKIRMSDVIVIMEKVVGLEW